MPYLVGERGPELRVFGEGGAILPADTTLIAAGGPRRAVGRPQRSGDVGAVRVSLTRSWPATDHPGRH